LLRGWYIGCREKLTAPIVCDMLAVLLVLLRLKGGLEGADEQSPWELVPHRRGNKLCNRKGPCLAYHQINQGSNWVGGSGRSTGHGGQLAGASWIMGVAMLDGAKPGGLEKSAGAPHARATSPPDCAALRLDPLTLDSEPPPSAPLELPAAPR